MNKLTLNIFRLLIFISTSCNVKMKDESSTDLIALNDSIKENIKTPFLDSIIYLSNITTSKYKGTNLTDSSAKIFLYEYAKKKGYYTSDNLPDMSSMSDEESRKLSVMYDTIYTLNLNNNKYQDAIITFWLTPPYANGHCWLPHKAIIFDTDKGYKISNEEFIPPNYYIENVSTTKNEIILLGYEFQCGNNIELRKFRIKIQ